VAALETGVPVLAFDADRLEGVLHLRLATDGEGDIAPGTAVVADDLRPVAVLFGEADPDYAVTGATRRIAFAGLQVKGVADVSAQEALWTCVEICRGGAA
jgi:DNA/RNA-binding domain of Phe-tRNA-synthetase-like protein